jgi:ABC-2 type transport system permease protein
MLAPRDDTQLTTVHRPWAVVIRSFAFVRKEIVEILRQPRLVALLVVGPFLLLLLFGTGYSQTDIEERAIFVAPEDSIYAEVLETYEEDLSEFIDSQGLVDTVQEGRAALEAGDTDVVVIFPENPQETVMSGERAVIEVLHDDIDPIQQAAIEVAARLAVQEVNATVLATLASEAQTQLRPAAELADDLVTSSQALNADPVGARDALRDSFGRLGDALDGSANILDRLDAVDEETAADLDEARSQATELAAQIETLDENTSDEELAATAEDVSAFAADLDEVVVLDPNVLVRPFESDTESVVPGDVDPTDYFTPGSLALLLQHLALTFAALSIVRDRRTGLFELMRVGPLSSIEIIVGKIVAYLIVGASVGAVLVATAVLLLGISMAGSMAWLAAMVVGVLLASLALGMVLALISASESQAVQYAMLALLAGLFFSGFVLPLAQLTYPVKIVSWLLPVTYGIQSLQDVMLRGVAPDQMMVLGLGALIVGYGTIAIVGLRRRLRTTEG